MIPWISEERFVFSETGKYKSAQYIPYKSVLCTFKTDIVKIYALVVHILTSYQQF